MIDFYHDLDKGTTRMAAFGSPAVLAADIAICTSALYARTKTASPTAANTLKRALMAVFGEDSPIWTAEVGKGSEADVCTVLTVDRREAERQAQEAQDADA